LNRESNNIQTHRIRTRFEDLATQLSQFRESGNFREDAVLLSGLKKRILAMEEEMARGK
jgi:hypothetical protein